MKKSFLIISLVIALFLVVSGGVAVALDIKHDGEVNILGDNLGDINQKATLIINQPDANAPYVFNEDPPDAIPLLVQAGDKGINELNSILVIRNFGHLTPIFNSDGSLSNNLRESELRFDIHSYSNPPDSDNAYSFMNASIYTWGNDRILRLRPFLLDDHWTPAQDLGVGEIRIKNLGGNLAARIVALLDKEASLEFVKGPLLNEGVRDKRFQDDSHAEVVTTSKIYRPADSDDLRFAVVNDSGNLQDRMIIDSNGDVTIGGHVGIGTEPDGNLSGATLRVHNQSWGSVIQITNKWAPDDGGLKIYEGGGSDRTAFFQTDPGVPMSLLPGWNGTNSNSDSGVIIGKLGFNYNEPYRLYVEGDVFVNGTIECYSTDCGLSDKKFKDNVTPIESSLNKIMKIQGVSFNWKKEEYKDINFQDGKHYGVIAQEIENVIPEIVSETQRGDKKVIYTELIPILIEAMKEQQKTITELSDKVNELEREMKLKDSLVMTDTRLH